MTAKEREYWELFDLSDKDSTGVLDVEELRRLLAWLRENVAGGDTGWLTTMWEALPVADKEVTVDVDPIPPSDGAATEPVAAGSDAPPTRLEDLKFVEDGRMTLKEFIVWMDLVTHSFTKEAHAHLITNLKAILKKEKLYYQLFRMWDYDMSGTLDCSELMKVVTFFKEHFEAEEQRLKLENRFATLQSQASTVAKAEGTGDEEAPPPLAVPRASSDSLTGWTTEVFESIKTMTERASTVDLNGFHEWLRQVSGYLSEETFDAAMGELYDIVSKRVDVKQMFDLWDKDRSGALDFGEMGSVLQWLSDNMPANDSLNLAILWKDVEVPPDGKIKQADFEAWWLKISTRISPVDMNAIAAKLKERINSQGPEA